MQVHHFGEQQGDQHHCIHRLDDGIGQNQVAELVADAPLEKGHDHHRKRDQGRANIGNDDGQSHQHGQQQGVVESHPPEDHKAGNEQGQHFEKLAAHIVADLHVHLAPNLAGQVAIRRQILVEPAQNAILVLQEEKDQQWDQDQIDDEGDDADQR